MRHDYMDLRTERILLRRPREGDAASVFASFSADDTPIVRPNIGPLPRPSLLFVRLTA